MKKTIYNKLLSTIVLMLGLNIYAQQQGHNSMYMVNQYLLNPAVAGTEDYIDFKVGARLQWVGLEGAPTSYYLTGHGPIKKNINHKQYNADSVKVKPLPWHSAGFMLTGENTGVLLNKNSLFGTYAYHIPLSYNLNISLGASLGLQQYRVISENAKADAQGNIDKAISTNTTVISPDGNVGIWLYSSHFYIGTSSMQVLNKKIDVAGGQNADVASRLNRHFFATTGYRIKLDSAGKWALVPSLMFKAIAPSPAQLDINCKVRYMDTFWGGVSWRTQDALVFIIGMTLDKRFDVGYSYDLGTSKLGHFHTGSHEIVLGYRMPHLKHKPAPAQFW